MCTNFVLIKSAATEIFSDNRNFDHKLLIEGDFRPGNKISILTDEGIQEAIWWLYLRQTQEGWKLHPDYFSVNTNYAKLPKRPEFKRSGCLIPATAFTESQGDNNPHLFGIDHYSTRPPQPRAYSQEIYTIIYTRTI